jgi:small multidrug resistance family-3 protein
VTARSIALFIAAAVAEIGGVFVVGSLLCGVAFDGFRPDRFDRLGAGICLVGVAVIMYGR